MEQRIRDYEVGDYVRASTTTRYARKGDRGQIVSTSRVANVYLVKWLDQGSRRVGSGTWFVNGREVRREKVVERATT